MLSTKKSVFKRVLITIIIVLIAFSAISFAATKLIYDSVFARVEATEVAIPNQLTEMVKMREKHEFYSGEYQLAGYLYRSNEDVCKDTLVVVAPGFKAGADSYLWQIDSLLSYGWSVFAFDTTGSFGSQGDSSVGFAQELCDLKATLDHIEKNDRFGFDDIAIFGHSRGGYAACCSLKYNYDISAVISVSGINSAMDGVIGLSVDKIGSIAYGNYGFLWLYQAMLFGTDVVNTTAHDQISQSDTPVLIIHGSNDEQVPQDRYSIISHQDEINSDKVEYIICSEPDQNGHTSLLYGKGGQANEQLMAQINEFLDRSI